MPIQTYQLSLDFEQILNLVRQLPSVEQEKIRQEIEKINNLTPYTQQMADEMDELLAGVTVEED
ncbi:MAG: hypothetical protein HC852_17365 [Acaryochloridaceae cyanobacterium RU_4_10]|nr:hypothetical protein [Acaryochloridaceae cyanobacterium RU_4_10]